MKSFINYITEAKVSSANLDKVADIFKRIVEKQLQTKLYRFGGPRGISPIKKGIGILYFYDQNKALRLNYINGAIESITLWKAFKLGKKGDYTISFEGLGLLQAGKTLISTIRNPKPGKIRTYGETITESFLLSEASRISPSDFYELALKNVPAGQSIESIRWETIADIALANNKQIPSIIRSACRVPGTKGTQMRFDLTKLISSPEVKDPDKPGTPERDYFIKVTAIDKESGKIVSVKGDEKAKDLLMTMTGAINNPDYKKESKDPDTKFGEMSDWVRLICRGNRNALIIYGGPGIGKCAAPEELITIRIVE